MTNYTYSEVDFTNVINSVDLGKFHAAIVANPDITTAINGVFSAHDPENGTTYAIEFADELTQEEHDALDAVVAAFSDIVDYRESAYVEIDRAAGNTRSRYVTTTAGQDAVYMSKGLEAAEYKAKGYPQDTSKYYYIEAEMAATGKTAIEVADMLVQIKAQWTMLAAGIEQVRLTGKNTIKLLSTKAEIDAVKNQTIAILDNI